MDSVEYMGSIKTKKSQDWGLMIANAEGCLVGCDEQAKNMLRLKKNGGIGESIDSVLGFQLLPEAENADGTFVSPVLHNIGNRQLILYPRRTTIDNAKYLVILVGFLGSTDRLFCPDVDKLLKRVSVLEDSVNAFMECSHDGIIITDKEGNFIRWNKRLEEIYMVSAAEVKSGKDMIERGVYQHSSSVQALKEGKMVSVLNVSRKGRQVLSTAMPIRDGMGNITGTVVNVRDLTELKELESKVEEFRLAQESMKYRIEELQKESFISNRFVFLSERMQKMIGMIKKIADTDEMVLLTGETGVGKSSLAEIIHKSSFRKEKPFMAVNIASIPVSLLESELFGYEKGAFTGASVYGKPGLFELAHNGTLFLDEISEIPVNIQAKLLDVIEQREVRRIGGKERKKFDIRIITATNQDLEMLIKAGSFRKDLYYRINVIRLEVPPLRERGEDIVVLANSFLEEYCKKYKKRMQLGRGVDKILTDYSWPGNVRELQNLILRLVLTTPAEIITESDVADKLRDRPEPTNEPLVEIEGLIPLKKALSLVEHQMIRKAMELHGSTYKASRALGISQSTVVRKMQKEAGILKQQRSKRIVSNANKH